MQRGRETCGLFDKPFVSWRDDIALFIGTAQVARSVPDGNTLVVAAAGGVTLDADLTRVEFTRVDTSRGTSTSSRAFADVSGQQGAALRVNPGDTVRFKHNDIADLERVLKNSREKYDGAMIVADGVFSMSGDILNLPPIIELAKKYNIHFTLLSSDFVFDGKTGNYSETDKPNPLSVYGKSKWLAEQELLKDDYTNWAIARTIIVYGQGHNLNKGNIFTWLISELSAGREVSLITDHFRAPTWAEDLAEACLRIVAKQAKGIYHLSGPETLSIFDIGVRIANYLGVSETLIKASDSKLLNQAAPRPPKTGFNLAKAKMELDYSPHPIEETLDSLQNE